MGTLGMVYRPVASLAALKVCPLAKLTAVMLTSAIAACDGSSTWPVIRPAVAWPFSAAAESAARNPIVKGWWKRRRISDSPFAEGRVLRLNGKTHSISRVQLEQEPCAPAILAQPASNVNPPSIH